jgi:hypothetical protein
VLVFLQNRYGAVDQNVEVRSYPEGPMSEESAEEEEDEEEEEEEEGEDVRQGGSI